WSRSTTRSGSSSTRRRWARLMRCCRGSERRRLPPLWSAASRLPAQAAEAARAGGLHTPLRLPASDAVPARGSCRAVAGRGTICMVEVVDFHETARRIADAAGTLLLEIRQGLARGEAPERIREEGDRRSNELILELLRRQRPGDAVLSEEAPDDLRRLDAER